MKILLYSDLHISRTSSILPMLSDSIYTYRQKMIITTGQWLAQIAVNEKPDLIINLGDTFDQHTITSYDVDVASRFFQNFKTSKEVSKIPHLILVGNHEMINQNFNAIEILNNIDGVTVIKDSVSISSSDYANTKDNIQLAFLPYCNYTDILSYPDGDFLFSHQDIQGSTIRGDFKLPDGINTNSLKKYKLVFNGHIHKPGVFGNVINVGSVTTHSFSDDNDSVPQTYIFDTSTLNLKTFRNPYCPLFRKVEIKSEQELQSYIQNLDRYFKYVLNVICPFDIKENVKQILIDNKDIIINSRLNVRVENNTNKIKEQVPMVDLKSNLDIKQTFIDFLQTVDLKYPLDVYKYVVDGVDKDDKGTVTTT